MSLNIFKSLKFFLSKINVIFRYKKKKIFYTFKWIFFGKEISNFTYEIDNNREIVDLTKVITNLDYIKLENMLDEVDIENTEFKRFFSNEYFEDYANKNIFGRRIVWYLLVRATKPEIVIESGVDKGLGSALLIYALYKNSLDSNDNEYIGIDIIKNKKNYFNINNNKYDKFSFHETDTLKFLKSFKIKKKILYISDAEHNYEFEKKEYELIKEKMSQGSIIVSDNNSGALSDFSREHKKNILYFNEQPKNTWYNGAKSVVSYFY